MTHESAGRWHRRLTITEEADDLIEDVVETRGGPTAAMRLAAMPVGPPANGSSRLGLQLVLHPQTGDELVAGPGGAQLLIDPRVAAIVEDKTLDTAIDEDGNESLVLVGPDLPRPCR